MVGVGGGWAPTPVLWVFVWGSCTIFGVHSLPVLVLTTPTLRRRTGGSNKGRGHGILSSGITSAGKFLRKSLPLSVWQALFVVVSFVDWARVYAAVGTARQVRNGVLLETGVFEVLRWEGCCGRVCFWCVGWIAVDSQ